MNPRTKLLLLVCEFVARARGLLLAIFFAKFMAAEQLGAWGQWGVLAALGAPVLGFGLDSAMARFLPGAPLERQRRLLSTSMALTWGFAAILVPLVLLGRAWLFQLFWGGEERVHELQWITLALLSMVFLPTLSLFRSWYRANDEWNAYIALNLLHAFFTLAGVCVLGFATRATVMAATGSVAVEGTIIVVLALRHLGRGTWVRPTGESFRELVLMGAPLVPAAYGMWALNYQDRVFLVRHLPLTEIAVYNFCYAVGASFSQGASSPFWLAFQTKYSRLWNENRKPEAGAAMAHYAREILSVTFIGGLALLIAGRVLIQLLAKPQYVPGIWVMTCSFLAYNVLVLGSASDLALTLSHRQRLYSLGMVIGVIVNALLNWFWIPRYGINGAALATLVSFAAIAGCSFFLSWDHLPSWKLRARDWSALAAIGAGMAVLLAWINHAAAFSFLVRVILCLAVVGAATWASYREVWGEHRAG